MREGLVLKETKKKKQLEPELHLSFSREFSFRRGEGSPLNERRTLSSET